MSKAKGAGRDDITLRVAGGNNATPCIQGGHNARSALRISNIATCINDIDSKEGCSAIPNKKHLTCILIQSFPLLLLPIMAQDEQRLIH